MTALPATEFILDTALIMLTPKQRWTGAGEHFGRSGNKDMMLLIWVALLIVFVSLLLYVSMRRIKKDRRAVFESFMDHARAEGLTNRECQLLVIIADRAGLKKAESIFTMRSAFGAGAARIVEHGLSGAETSEQKKQLRVEIALLAEKLGYGREARYHSGHGQNTKSVTTREIPVGKKLLITRRGSQDASEIETTIVSNTDTELTVTLSEPARIAFGGAWSVRYNSGSSVWEFDTTVVSFDGQSLVLDHSEKVRFVNRRRFLRVPVDLPAMVASFPFSRSADDGCADFPHDDSEDELTSILCRAPQFLPAVVTELAGPGLRIEWSGQVNVGDRVLVIFRLENNKKAAEDDSDETPNDIGARIIEDVGIVRHSRKAADGYSIAVEFTTLSDTDVDELIRATNFALIRTNTHDKHEEVVSDEAPQNPEPAVAQKV